MAGGGSPRQRMINLMYLVFISMMAMNMGKEVLGAFGSMNLKLEDGNKDLISANTSAYEGIVQKSEEDQTFKLAGESAKKIKQLSDDYYKYLSDLKADVMNQGGSPAEDPTDYQVMDKGDYLDNKFFTPDGLKPEGKEFYDRYVNYRDEVLKLVGDNQKLKALVPALKKRFDDGENGKVKNREGNTLHWVNARLEGFPYIAAVTFMSQIQADIRKTEQEFYNELLGEGMRQQVSMKNYTTLLEQAKGAFYTNQTFEGAVVLGRKDNNTRPSKVDLAVDGRKLSASEYEVMDGKISLKFNTGGVGDHKITGTLTYEQDGQETPVQVDQTYTTIPRPNEAVISADKMNVVYVGVDNPMTISMPGVSDNLINASAPNLRKVGGSKYVIRPTKGGGDVTINVTGTIEGERFSSSKKFRVKNLPKPEGAVFGQTGDVRLPKANLAAGQITVKYESFDFDLTANVTSFVVSVDGERIKVQGSRIGAEPRAVSAINRTKKGSTVQISEIKYKVTGYDGYNVSASPISVEITQ